MRPPLPVSIRRCDPTWAGFVLAALVLIASPAAAASSRGSFDRAPYFDGRPAGAVRPAAHVAPAFRTEPGSLDPTPDRSRAIAALLDSLRLEIGRLGLTESLAVDPRLLGGPDVHFGCRRGGTGADGTPLPPGEIDTREPRRMAFEVEGPSKAWREAVAAGADSALAAIVSVQLRFGDYWVRQKDIKGGKTIELGAGRTMELPWLTSLDDPVQVLQVTGALVSRSGRVLRVGAEALGARRTGMTASVLGAQEVFTEQDLRALLDPPADGTAPAWRVALRALVEGLLGEGAASR